MTSEADLDTEIKSLSILSEHTDLYPEFTKLGCVGSLISLLSHENADIAIGAIQIISELTDDDVEAEQEQWDVLVNAMVGCHHRSWRTVLMKLVGSGSHRTTCTKPVASR